MDTDNRPVTVIFDLDGTLALIDERRRKATRPNGSFNWDEFFNPKNIPLDMPNYPVLGMYNLCYHNGVKCVIYSGRSARTKTATIHWLLDHIEGWHNLRMRPEGDFRPDDEIKREWIEEDIDRYRVMAVYDDRQKVVDMWRSIGLTCFQVAPGDF